MNYPFVSIIVPAKNEYNIIGTCFNALRNIEYPNNMYEIILVDNGSSDNTINIARDNGICYYIKPGITISALRNFGANIARGEILAFVDADVIVSRDWLKNALKNFEDSNIVCTGSSPDISSNSTWVERIWNLQTVARKGTRTTYWLASMNLIVRKNAFMDVGGFNEEMITCEDVDLCYRLGKKWKILYDSNIKAVHLGEAKTLTKLFKKESWRGIGNFTGFMSHGIHISEIPSHCVALYNFAFTILFPVFFIAKLYYYVATLTLILLVFPVMKSLIISCKIKSYKYFFQLLIVWLVYGIGRGWSVWRIITLKFDR